MVDYKEIKRSNENKIMNNNEILVALEARAKELTNSNVAGNKSVTAITVSSSGPVIGARFGNGSGSTFYEPAFSGCGSINFVMPKSDFRLAKTPGFKKDYSGYSYGYAYYNGQFGDACRAYNDALNEFKTKYPNTFLDKVSVRTYID